jgi:hypothetical protein
MQTGVYSKAGAPDVAGIPVNFGRHQNHVALEFVFFRFSRHHGSRKLEGMKTRKDNIYSNGFIFVPQCGQYWNSGSTDRSHWGQLCGLPAGPPPLSVLTAATFRSHRSHIRKASPVLTRQIGMKNRLR